MRLYEDVSGPGLIIFDFSESDLDLRRAKFLDHQGNFGLNSLDGLLPFTT